MQDWPDGYPSSGNKTRRAPRVGLIILLASLCGALAGVAVSYIFIVRSGTDAANNTGVVVIQSAPPVDAKSVAEIEGASYLTYNIVEVASAAAPSVLEIITNSKAVHPFYGSYVISGAGSAVAMTADGYLITNNHVVKDATEILARTHDGHEYTAALIGFDAQTDLAILKIDAADLAPVVFADSDTASVGELCVAIGNPLGTLGGTVTEGILSAKDRAITIDGQTMLLLQTSAAINPGNSGGGLFDGSASLLGIVVAKANESGGIHIEGVGYAIPSNIVRRVAAELVEHGYVTGRPALGVAVRAITSRYDLMRYQLDRAGVYVMNAFKDSSIMLWDQILTVDGQPIAKAEDITAALNGVGIGESMDVVVRRRGEDITINMIVREKTPDMTDADMV